MSHETRIAICSFDLKKATLCLELMVEIDQLVDEAVPFLALIPYDIIDLDEKINEDKSVMIMSSLTLRQYIQSTDNHLVMMVQQFLLLFPTC